MTARDEPARPAVETVATVVDAMGRRCPTPVIELARALPTVRVGEVVAVLADDEAARLDIPAWCSMRDQEYVGEEPYGTGRAYLIRRHT